MKIIIPVKKKPPRFAPVLISASKYSKNHMIHATKQLSKSSCPDLEQSKELEIKQAKKNKKKKDEWNCLFTDVHKVNHRLDCC